MKKIITSSLLTLTLLSTATTSVSASTFENWGRKIDSFLNNNKDKIDKATDYLSELEKVIDSQFVDNTPQSPDMVTDELSDLPYDGGSTVMILNGNESSFEFVDFKEPRIEYSNLDHLNRAGKVTAYLTKENVIKSDNRSSQTFLPTGFVKNAKTHRGHLIAYTLSGNLNDDGRYAKGHDGSLDNPKNLFTQTADSNTGDMQVYEKQILDALKKGSKVIYSVTPIFKGDELMARGVWLQAVSNDNSVEFNVYLHNVSDDHSYDYMTGHKQ